MPSFSGISAISMAGEEVRKPSRNIPIAHTMVAVVSFVLLFMMSGLVTLTTPAANLSLHAPLLDLFEDLRVKNSKYLIGIGCTSGLTLAIIVQLHHAERLLYAMVRDKLLPHRLAIWHYDRGSPWLCRFFVVGISAVLALFIPFQHLLTQVSIDILVSFAATCLAVVVIRYDPCQIGLEKGNPLRKTVSAESFVLSQASSCISQASYSTANSQVSHSINPTVQKTETAILLTQDKATSTEYSTQRCRSNEPEAAEDSPDTSDEGLLPDLQSYHRVLRTLYSTLVMSLIFAALTRFGWKSMQDPFGWVILTFCLLCVFLNFCGALYISRAPTTHKEQVYAAGGVPFIQILAVMGLCVMLFSVDTEAWIRWTVWTSIGKWGGGKTDPIRSFPQAADASSQYY
ncbi:hypothetical protein RvY_13619-2 [Ramazzottius varieornatus]|uniref:Amino acid permease/ SLC12A domain-containing protein n=1 Tax=Ramazzottius varieornatus TaxID=947166 RepID=A0A1D1VX15_RAMVA|nr:hypothetical protein RvY_13619-2 [Ramazzottius varieornatus]